MRKKRGGCKKVTCPQVLVVCYMYIAIAFRNSVRNVVTIKKNIIFISQCNRNHFFLKLKCDLHLKFYDIDHFLVKRYDRYNSHQCLPGRPCQVYYNIFLCFVGKLVGTVFPRSCDLCPVSSLSHFY